MDRVSKGSIGFNAHVRTDSVDLEDEKFRGYTPFFTPNEGEGGKKKKFNPLELAEPGDLINFGLIPEIVSSLFVFVACNHGLIFSLGWANPGAYRCREVERGDARKSTH